MECSDCNGKLPKNGNYVHCNACEGDYHYNCTTLSERSYKTMSGPKKMAWKCHECRKYKSSQESTMRMRSSTPRKKSESEEYSENESFTTVIETGDRMSRGNDEKVSDKSMEKLFDQFESKLWKKMSKKLTDIEEFMSFASGKIDDFTKYMKEIQKKLVAMEVEQEKMRQENMELKSKFKSLEVGVNENAQMFNRNKMEISNIPTTVTNVNEVVAKVLEKVNGEKIEEKCYDIEVRKYENQVNAIVQFESVVQRDKIVKKKRAERTIKLGDVMNTTDDNHNIYINESLTPYYAKLYAEAKKLKREKNYAFIWIRDGKILLKKTEQSRPMRLMAMEDLGKM
uniref:PHD-type domain-containing protein n=1 Tax=Cacopsylla melanoneura TaxID=428564 RepID=A0A8D9ATW8_9HEMI